VVLLEHLETGAKRFGQLRDSTAGIREKVLTQTLRSLERDGLIARRVHPGAAPTVEYRLAHCWIRSPWCAPGHSGTSQRWSARALTTTKLAQHGPPATAPASAAACTMSPAAQASMPASAALLCQQVTDCG
jgi:hypothetical protein